MSNESDIYNVFKNDGSLIALLGNGTSSIYEGISPDSDNYPQVVFANISTVPAGTADDAEYLKRVSMQISIITKDDEYDNIKSLVDTDMHSLGYMFDSETSLYDADECTKILRYVKQQEVE